MSKSDLPYGSHIPQPRTGTAFPGAGSRYRDPLGRGRSGVVYRAESADGKRVAVKVLRPDAITQAFLTVLTGAPNPYRWNADAAQCIVYRRRILSVLVRYWFGRTLRIPATAGPYWNESQRAFEVESELITSSHLPLTRGAADEQPEAMKTLIHQIMRPLQRHLIDSGCVGLVWQAGLGNPVAGGNFMLDSSSATNVDRWVWIDLESGIPPLLPLNPLAMFRFYLPQMLRRRRSLRHARSRDWITAEEEPYYRERPLRWLSRQVTWGLSGLGRRAQRTLNGVSAWIAGGRWRRYLPAARDFAVSPTFRSRLSRRYVHGRLASWKSRGFLDARGMRQLRWELRRDRAAHDISDFGVHLALKPPVSIVQFWVLPILFVIGAIDGLMLSAGLLFGEALVRTLYTSGRMVQCSLTGQRPPWIALVFGTIPMVGVAAFPLQMLYTGTRQPSLSRFIICDTFASIGRAVPIWGGRDSLIEHVFNRFPTRFFAPREVPASPASTLVQEPVRHDGQDRVTRR